MPYKIAYSHSAVSFYFEKEKINAFLAIIPLEKHRVSVESDFSTNGTEKVGINFSTFFFVGSVGWECQ